MENKSCEINLTASIGVNDKTTKLNADAIAAQVKNITGDDYNLGYVIPSEPNNKLLFWASSDNYAKLNPIVEKIIENDTYKSVLNNYYLAYKRFGYGAFDAFLHSVKQMCLTNSAFYGFFERTFPESIRNDYANKYLEEKPTLSESQKKNSQVITRFHSDTDESAAIYLTILSRIGRMFNTVYDKGITSKSGNNSFYLSNKGLEKLVDRFEKFGIDVSSLFGLIDNDANGLHLSNDIMNCFKEYLFALENIGGFYDFVKNISGYEDLIDFDEDNELYPYFDNMIESVTKAYDVKPYYQVISSQDVELPLFMQNKNSDKNEQQKTDEEQINEVKKLNDKFNIIIDNYNAIIRNFNDFVKKTNGIVAYRIANQADGSLWKNPQAIREKHIVGNPFSYGQKKEEQDGKSAEQFYKWLINGEYMDEANKIMGVKNASEIRTAMLDVIYDSNEDVPILYDKVLKTKSHAQVIGYLLRNKDKIENYSPSPLFFSGGARGADVTWGEAMKKYGFKTVHLSSEKDEEKRERYGLTQAFYSKEQYNKAVRAVHKANETLRHNISDEHINMFLARDYEQVRRSDMVVAIADAVEKSSSHQGESHIEAKGTPWAVQMAIDEGKPVYVYDLKKKIWVSNIDGNWNFSGVEKPVFKPRTALVGTTTESEDLRRVIADTVSYNYGKSGINGYVNDNPFTDSNAAESERVLNSEKTILTQSEVNDWNEGKKLQNPADPNIKEGFRYPRILAASEQTDPAFHVEWIKNFFDGKINHTTWQRVTKEEYDKLPNNKRMISEGTTNDYKKKVVVTSQDIDGLYLITKHDGLPTLELLKMCKEKGIPLKIHFSITTLGHTNFEKGVMESDELLKRIGDYIDMGYLDPNDVTLRVDPIVPDVTNFGTGAEGEKNTVHNIFKFAQQKGIKQIKFSILDYYPEGMTVGGKNGNELIPELKEVLTKAGQNPNDYFETKYGKDNNGNIKKDANQFIKDSIAAKMIELRDYYATDDYCAKLITCAEVISKTTTDVSGNTIPLGDAIEKTGCLSVNAVQQMLGMEVTEKQDDYSASSGVLGQRTHCSCFKGKVAALRRNDICMSHCLYCFATHQSDAALELYNEDGSLKANQWTITHVEDLFKEYEEKFGDNENVSTVKGFDNTEYNISDKNFIESFTTNSEVEIFTDSMKSALSDLQVNDLIRVVYNVNVTTAYVKRIETTDKGMKISFYPKTTITMPADYSIIADKSEAPIMSIGDVSKSNFSVDLKTRLGSSKYQTYVNTTSNLLGKVIKANIKGKMKKEKLHDALNTLGGFNGVLSILKKSIEAQLNQENAYAKYVEAAMKDLVAYKKYKKENIEDGREEAEKIAKIRMEGHKVILDNIDTFGFDAITKYAKDNNLVLVTDESGNTKTSSKEREDADSVRDKEMEEKESWQFDAANAHAFKSISQELKEFLEKFPMLTPDKNVVLDEMYMPVFISANKAYNALQYILTKAFTFQEMMDIVSEYSKTHPEFKKVVTYFDKEENKNNGMQQKFFQLFNKQKNNFEVLYTDDKKDKKEPKRDENGNIKTITYTNKQGDEVVRQEMQPTHSLLLNELDGSLNQQTTYIDALKNISNQVKLSLTPFNNNEWRDAHGKAKSNELIKSLRSLRGSFNQQGTMSNKDYVKWLGDNQDDIETIYQAVCGLGINVSRKEFDDCISFNVESAFPIDSLMHELYELFQKKGGIDDFFNNINSSKTKNALQRICKIVHNSTQEEDRTATTRADNKDYALYKNPSYLSNLIKHILDDNTERRNKWIEEEFRQYDWFYKSGNHDDIADKLQSYVGNFSNELSDSEKRDINNLISRLRNRDNRLTENSVNKFISNLKNKSFLSNANATTKELDDAVFVKGGWNNSVIEELCENPDIYKNLKHTITLTFNKEGYAKLTESEYLACVLDNFFRYRSSDTMHDYANFVLPILADANSFEFLRLKKRGGVDACVEEMFKVFLQEKERIKLIATRENLRMIAYSEFNKIKSLGSNLTKKDIPEYYKWYKNGQFESHIRNIIKFDKDGKIENPSVLKDIQLTDIPYYSLPIANFDDNDDIKFTQDGLIDLTSIKTKQGQGHKLQFVSFLNNYLSKDGINKLVNSKDDDAEAKSVVCDVIRQEIRKDRDKLLKQVREYGYVLTKGSKDKYDFYSEEGIGLIEEFAAEHMYAHASIIQLTVTDLAQYKNAVDFQKRYKQIYAATARMDTSAPYGRETAKNLLIKDRILRDRLVEELKAIIKESKFDNDTKNALMDAFSKINASDAQSFRSFSSLRAIMSMSGTWDEEEHGVIFDKLINGKKLTASEMETALQTIKPFLFTQLPVSTKIGDNKKMKVGFQIKNSEFILLYLYTQLNNLPEKDSQVILALNRFMEDNNIDVVHFESAIKVGLQGPLDFNDDIFKVNVNTEKIRRSLAGTIDKTKEGSKEEYDRKFRELYKEAEKREIARVYNTALSYMYKATNIEKPAENETFEEVEERVMRSLNPEVIHLIPYSEYGIITSTPEHYAGKKQRIGTQLLRLISINNNADDYTVGENKMNGQQIYKKLNELLNSKMLIHFDKLKSKIKNPKDLENFLLDTMRGNSKYTSALINAIRSKDKNGNLNMLGDPIVYGQIDSILNALIRTEVNEMELEGGTCIQVSPVFAHDLHIVYADRKVVDKETGEVHIEHNIAYWECRLPVAFKSLYEKVMDDDGCLSISKLYDLVKEGKINKTTADKLLRVIGIRIPTEAKHSIQHLKCVGFIEGNNGSSVMLPAEITQIAGSDYDVDKLYIYRYSFKINEDGYPEYVMYDFNKPIHLWNEAQINNCILDCIWAVLEHPASAGEEVSPSNYDRSKKAAYISALISDDEYLKVVDKIYKEETGNENATKLDLFRYLKNMDVDDLGDILNQTSNRMSIYNQLRFFIANTRGKELLGIMAVNNTAQALMQHTSAGIKQEYSVTIDGRTFTSLSNDMIRYDSEHFVLATKTIEEWITAAADNTKDPVLAYLGINRESVNVAVAMARLGYDPLTIGIFMNHPEIKRIFKELENQFISPQILATKILERFTTEYNSSGYLDIKKKSTFKYLSINDKNEVKVNETNDDLSLSTDAMIAGTEDPQKVLFALYKMFVVGQDLNDIASISRADSTSGSVGASMAENISKNQKINYISNRIENDKTSLVNCAGIIRNIQVPYGANLKAIKPQIMKLLNESISGYVQGQTTFALQSLPYFFKGKLPVFSDFFLSCCNRFAQVSDWGYLSDDFLKRMAFEYVKYTLCKLPFFGYEFTNNGFVSIETKVKTVKENMWSWIKTTMVEYPELKENVLLKSLQLSQNGIVVLPDAGNLENDFKESITNAWADLLNSNYPKVKALGMNLLRYSFYRSAFRFAPDGFGHLAPDFRHFIEGYEDAIMKSCNSNEDITSFVSQFIKNNPDVLPYHYKNSPVREGQLCYFTKDDRDDDRTIVYYTNAYTGTSKSIICNNKNNEFTVYGFNADKNIFLPSTSANFADSKVYESMVKELDDVLNEIKNSDKTIIDKYINKTLTILNKTWC